MSKLILTILLFITLCQADVTYNNSGSLDYALTRLENKNVNTIDLVINNDVFIGDKTKIVFSPGILGNDDSTYNSIVKGDVERVREIYINELYISYMLTDRLSVAVGVFPYRKGAFYEYGFNGYRAGNGLYSITDNVLQGVVFSYKIEDTVIQIGKVKYEQFMKSFKDYDKTNLPITYDSYKDSGMNYIAIKQKYEKWYFDLELSKVYQCMNGYEIINSDIYSLGISYNDDVDTGRTYYTLLSSSKSKGNTGSLAYTSPLYYGGYIPAAAGGTGNYASPNGKPGDIPPFHDARSHYDSFETEGWYALLGVKQEIDHLIFNKDVVLSFEYAYRSEGYHSLLAGRPLSPHAYADIGDFYNISVGLRINKNNMVKLRYYMYDTNSRSTKYGFTPVTTASYIVQGSKDKYDALVLQWYLDF